MRYIIYYTHTQQYMKYDNNEKIGNLVAIRISLYYLELTANSFNIFVLCQKRVCFFIVKNESFISGLQKYFSKRRKFDVSPTVAIFVKTKQKKNFEKDFKGPQMQLSDLTMKKQILFGQIWKRLKIIVVDLNHYELILIYTFSL